MFGRLIFMLGLGFAANAAVVIDRVAVVVDKHVIKLSDIDRDLRMTEFLNREPLSETPEQKRKAADRLVDQELIREELAAGGYGRATDAEVEAMMKQLAPRRQSLSQYGLTEDQLRAQLLWQLTVLRFIDQRFRSGVLVTDEEVQAGRREHPGASASQIRTTLEAGQVDKEFESWLAEARKRTKVEYRAAAFQAVGQ